MNYSESCQQIGYAILQEASKPMAEKMNEAIDFMVENCKDANWDAIHRSMKILTEPEFGTKPYTDKLFKWMMEEMNKEFNKDMIYYSLCYDGFRV